MDIRPSFFSGLKKALIVLVIIGVVASVLCFTLLPGITGRFYGIGVLVLVLNILLMYFFIRVNDNKRPGTRRRDSHKDEEKRFDFRKERR